jgi:hypothetical protein
MNSPPKRVWPDVLVPLPAPRRHRPGRGKVKSGFVRSERRDRKAAGLLPKIQMPAGCPHLQPLVEARPTSIETPSNDNAEYKEEKTPKQRLPEWDETTDVLKVIVANRALIEHGIPYAFTLNPSPKEIKKALAHKDGPKKYFAARISRWLRQELGYVPMHWFVLECDRKTSRLHLHGGIALDHNVVPRACEALKKAGGKWTNILGKQFQLKLKAQYAPDGWARYSLKHRGFTKKVIATDALVFIPNDLRSQAKHLLEAERRRQAAEASNSATPTDELSMTMSLTGDPSPSDTPRHRNAGCEPARSPRQVVPQDGRSALSRLRMIATAIKLSVSSILSLRALARGTGGPSSGAMKRLAGRGSPTPAIAGRRTSRCPFQDDVFRYRERQQMGLSSADSRTALSPQLGSRGRRSASSQVVSVW